MDATPINTPAGTTVLSSIRLNGSLVYTTYQGGTTAQRFREYMGKQLIPSLEKDDVVIMDNMRSHHAKIVTELLEYITNIYYVLMTRGIKGTYLYVCDENLREYLRPYIEVEDL